MLRTGIVLIPNAQGGYEEAYNIAKEYTRIAHGVLRANAQISTSTIVNEILPNFSTKPRNNKLANLESACIENLTKFLLDRKSFATFYCARIILIFSDLFHFPPMVSNEVPENEIIQLANQIISKCKDKFDDLYVDIIAVKNGLEFHKQNDRYTIHIIDGDRTDVQKIACFHMGISRLNLGPLSVLFKQADKTEDMELPPQSSIEYFLRVELNPIVQASYNCCFAADNEELESNVENELKEKVCIINQKFMLTLNSTSGLRICRIGSLPTVENIENIETFLFKPIEDKIGLITRIPSAIVVSPTKPGFKMTRSMNIPAEILMKFINDESVSIFIKLMESSPQLLNVCNEILTPIFHPEPDQKIVKRADTAVEQLNNMAQREDTSVFSEKAKNSAAQFYNIIFVVLDKFAAQFKLCSKVHEGIYNKIHRIAKVL